MNTNESNQTIRSVFNTLKITYGVLPVVAGIDKFTDILTKWENYLNPNVAKMLPLSPHTFMMMVGIIEILAGIIVFVKPIIGSYVVSAWLILIALSLLTSGNLS